MSRKVYCVLRQDQLAALASSARHDIVDRLTALGPLLVSELASALGRKPSAIYRHLRALEKLGLVHALETSRERGGRPAAIYQAVAPVIRLSRAARIATNRRPMARIAKALATRAARDYENAFKSERRTIEGPARTHWFFQLLSAPSPKKLARINLLLDELAELIWTRDPSPGPLINMTFFMSPRIDRTTRRP